MDFDLQAGLHNLSNAPTIAPDTVPVDRVLTRVHRGRALRATTVGAVSLAVVVGAAVAMYAAPWNPTPLPPASPSPTPTPQATPDPTPEPSPEPTFGETPDPVDPPIVALTDAGALVMVDPETGATTHTVYEGLSTDDTLKIALTVSPDRRYAFVSQVVDTEPGTRWEILRISLASGSAEPFVEGMQPAISPDGATLAYAGFDPSIPEDPAEEVGFSLVLRDLATGAERYIPFGYGDNPAAWLDQIAWSPDGATLYVPRGMEGSTLVAIDANAASFEQAVELGDGLHESEPVVLADGTLVVFCDNYDIYDAPDGKMYVAVIDPLSGSVTAHVEPVSGRNILDMAARPSGRGLAYLALNDGAQPSWDLYRWDDGGEARLLAQGFLAIAW